MSDFFQNGNVSTLHNLTRRPVEDIEAELVNFSANRPIGLVLPSLYSELEAPALENIVSELAKVPYLSRVVIGLDRADADQFAHAKEYFSRLPQDHVVIWHDGPRMQALDEELAELSLALPNSARVAMSGTASAICLPPAMCSPSACMIAISSPMTGHYWPA